LNLNWRNSKFGGRGGEESKEGGEDKRGGKERGDKEEKREGGLGWEGRGGRRRRAPLMPFQGKNDQRYAPTNGELKRRRRKTPQLCGVVTGIWNSE
jgi:hypothetical protein